ncbi:1-deoxy-D-xylulose-5-phosphate reductoisomerase [Coralloluteibacterium thermophilus]|uniref:1-deoxy-D-xylulose 5-phosphate reductoisomerase n=1 Tax=Coralloluteibacterium thermophilum TaxID=2707049 RepID=A0ABV9NNU9_9GAMM
MNVQRVAVLGATGSIGTSSLDVIARHPDRFQATVLSANAQVDALVALCARFRPRHAVVADPARFGELAEGLRAAGLATVPHAGPDALGALAASDEVDTVIAAIVGAAGVASTLAAARAGKRLLLANKESVVLAGALLIEAVARGSGSLIPVDSEHSAIFQCLPHAADDPRGGVRRLLLTASGGPFRGRSRAELATVTPEQACAHPNWSMGRKISVDSASMMNKGLEVIEAHWLFGMPPERIEVVVHPQSVVHSLVDYVDGSVLAQLGAPDMRTAIACALAWPQRVETGVAPLDLAALARLDFEAPDMDAFPCLRLAFQALGAGGAAAAVLNAANEVAVSAFLQRRLRFLDIPDLIAAVLDDLHDAPHTDLEALLDADARARSRAAALIPTLG